MQFFYRKLKPEARPIAQPQDMDVVVSAADCRLSAFATVDDATRCWIKVCAAWLTSFGCQPNPVPACNTAELKRSTPPEGQEQMLKSSSLCLCKRNLAA